MKLKQLGAFALCLFAAAVLFALPASALDAGAYTAPCGTYYLNPDTGVTDDGGTKNAAIGEGMCRSAVYKDALIEVENGSTYLTIRMQLMSNIKDIKFSVQKTAGDPGSYQAVSYSTMQEDSSSDTADMRFKVPKATAYIRCDMYVIPMGRAVVFYMQVNSGSASKGGGDFVVSVDTPAPASTPPAAGSPAAGPQEPSPPAHAETPAAALAPTPSVSPDKAAASTPPGSSPAAAANASDATASPAPAESASSAPSQVTPEEPENSVPAEGPEASNGNASPAPVSSADPGAETDSTAERGGFPTGAAAAVAVVVVVVVLTIVVRKKGR
ncbi:Iron Transport-associated domain-containing protein [Sporobacter termitidis DSM 10068]|uniref:Iron Transport-associated domain-containing protein n=1 Tax=Sporobacter termitidis DSM 10068 TaxID=1123282 RepID=A0A1M5WLG5_9FIRM|nr:heme-binding Shp domain-containing protein [Sporobacter termitidis]SHH88395.1 Iron Transport-associated domain-containing protein [Sporobacter termitidis DSM 10068]